MRELMKAMALSTVMVLLFAPMAAADKIGLNRVNGYFSGNGGEFTVYTALTDDPAGDGGLASVVANYAAVTKVTNTTTTFQTFCVELNEYATPLPGTYDYTIGTSAIAGGAGGPKPDPISLGTAYLYIQFAMGTLAGYDYTGANRAADAGALQNAIWYLEEETSLVVKNNEFLKLAITDLYGSIDFNDATAVDQAITAIRVDNNGAYKVAALNLTFQGQLKQSHLVYTPEPGTLLMMGIGLLGAAAMRRKFKKR